MVLVPLYNQPDLRLEKFACVLTLNLYELSLLAVALLIVTWRRAFDDAVAVTVISAIFLIVTPITLDTAAPGNANATLLLGLGGLLLALPKLWAMQRYVTGTHSALRIAGLTVLLAWNLLMPGVLSYGFGPGAETQAVRPIWWAGWWISLGGAALLWLDARLLSDATGLRLEPGVPFLRTVGMRWIVAGIVFLGSFVHQLALSWAFGLGVTLAEFTPPLAVACLLVLELRRASSERPSAWDYLLAVLPMAAVVGSLASSAYLSRGDDLVTVASYPPLVALVFGVALLFLPRPKAWRALRFLGAPYAALGALAMGTEPGRPFPLVVDGYELFRHRVGWLLVVASFVILAAGAYVSVRKSRGASAEPDIVEHA
jgi:hypothetical protein